MSREPARYRRRIVYWVLFWIGLVGLWPVVAQNLLITDYRVPVSTAEALRVNFDYNYKRVGDEEIENSGSFFANYKYFYDSFRFGYSIEATASADKSEDGEFYSLITNENVRAYVVSDLFVGAEFRRRFHTVRAAEAELVASVGYGRFINATPLAKAVRMEDWLLELGQLEDDLPAETMIELGQIIQREDEFRDAYGETYRQHWFKAMEDLIRESGMLKVPELEAMALLRMEEVLTRERVFDRFYGWEISAGGGTKVLDPEQTFLGESQSVEATLRISRPFGWRTQWNGRATVATPLGDDFREAYSVAVQSDFSYELSDRIDLLLSYQLFADRERPLVTGEPGSSVRLPFEVSVTHRLQGTLVFFIENSLTLNLNALLNSTDGEMRRTATLTFGYRLF